MNQVIKKSISVLMAFLMILSLFAGMYIPADAATVDYQYGSTGSYPNVIKNWGTRGEPATFLSPNAEAFYANTSYEELAELAGSSNLEVVDTSALYVALFQLMSGAHSKTTTYDDTRYMFQYTDSQANGANSTTISAFYSGETVGPAWDGGNTWNREHIWPNSKGGDGESSSHETDIMMLRPETKNNNSSRGNKAYGRETTAAYYYPNLNTTYDVRGDVARVLLYQYVRWGTREIQETDKSTNVTVTKKLLDNMWGSDGVIESLEVLLEWMEADPVDTWEMGRNDSVQSITGTRNVFVDYPELAFELFEEEVPADYSTPSGSASSTSYTITALSGNTAYGTVSVNGNNITAYPASGYQVAGYQITSGSATVKQNGNVFTVAASSDCTIVITFEPAEKYTVRIVENGVTQSAQQIQVNQSFTLPAFSGTLPEGYTFIGWTLSSVENSATKPVVYAAGSSVKATSAMTFYAVASYFDEESGGTEMTWTLVTDASEIAEGSQVIIAAKDYDYAMSTEQKTNNRGQAAITKNGSSMTYDSEVQILTLYSGTVDGTYAFYTGSGYLYAASNSSNHLKTQTTLNDNGSFAVSIESDGTATLTAQGSNTRNLMQYNKSSSLFSCYGSNSQQFALSLYVGKSSSGTTYYTTAWGCKHINKTPVDTAPTCTEQGYTTLYCADCGQELDVKDYVPALGHNYQSVVTAPTFTTQGYTTHTCTACGDSYTTVTDVAGWSLTLGSDLSVNFKISVDDSIRETAKVCISVAGAEKTYEVSELTANADGTYLISVKLAAAQMTDEIAVQLINGADQSEKKSYSVRAYADSILAGEYSEATKTLVTQMLHYGAAAQNYFNYHTERLANADLEAPGQVTPTTDKAAAYTGTVDGVAYSGATMLFRDKIAVRFYFQVTGDIGDYAFTVNGTPCTPVKKGDSYYIEAANINPQDLNTEIAVQVSSLTVSYSPMNYLVNMNRKGTAGLQSLVQALYAYHLAAQAYLSA